MDYITPRWHPFYWLLGAVIAVLGFTTYAHGEIVKSLNDPRQYESFQLANQLEVLLVSDPTTDKAAAALDVHVGSGSDPKGREGLAHFLEHMLFLGTEKYPVVGDYKKFVTTNGGRVNAYTTFDHTNYFFDVGKDHLEPALDRFAQFFVAPLFPEAYVDREKHAVHSEYKSKFKNDTWNRLRAYKNAVNPQHPFAQFAIGSLETLSDREDSKIRDELIAFYQQHYSANLMKLVVLGKEPLPQLKQWVTEKFSEVKNASKWAERPQVSLFKKEQLPGRLNIVPIKEQRSLILSFPIPASDDYYLSKPVQHISYLLGHEGSGSLFAFLKAKGWVYGLSAGQGVTLGDESTFDVGVRLTDEGLNHIPEIVSYVFQSIALIKKEGVSEWVHQERLRLANVAFRFQEPSTPIRYVKILAKRMHQYPIQDVLRGPYALDYFAPELINEYLNMLTPDRLLMTVSAKQLNTDAVDPWFGTHYQLRALPDDLLAQWQNSEIDLALTVPQRNIFLPEDLSVKPLRQTSTKPELIKSVDGFALWYKQDDSFHVPRSDFYASIRSPFANNTSRNAVLTELYVRAVNDQMNEFAYSARLGGLRFKLYKHMRGIALKISGYNDKQAQLLEQVVTNLKQPNISPERFALLKNELMRELDNANYRRPYKQILSELTNLLLQDYWDKKQQRLALETLEQVDLENFIPQLFDKISIISLAHGNVYPEEVLAVADSLEQLLREENKPGIVPVSRVNKLAQGKNLVHQVPIDHGDSAISVYFQGSDTSFSNRAKFKLLAYTLSSPFFQDLRTEKQLGYVVFSATLPIMKVPGIVFTVQSPSADPVVLENSVEEFLKNYAGNIVDMTDEDFESYKRGLLTRILFKEKSLSERTARYWTEVNNGYHDFDSRDQLAQAIKSITKIDFQQAYYRYLLSDARKRVVVRSFGKGVQKTYSDKNLKTEDQKQAKVVSREI
jgi:secreted Zn-dependent insulinase-like peptidase